MKLIGGCLYVCVSAFVCVSLCVCVLLLQTEYIMLIDSFPSVTVHILHSESTMSNFIDDGLAIETAERLMMAAEADQQSETESMI